MYLVYTEKIPSDEERTNNQDYILPIILVDLKQFTKIAKIKWC